VTNGTSGPVATRPPRNFVSPSRATPSSRPQRLGKNLIFALRNGTHLVVHLGMSGQLLRAKGPKDLKPKHTHVVFTFVQGGELRYVDPRTFGELYVSTPLPEGSELEISKFARLSIGGDGLGLRREIPELAHLGIDPFEDQLVGTDSPPYCAAAPRRSRWSSPIRTSSRTR